MIQTINPIVYDKDARREKDLTGIVTETVLSYTRFPLEKKYEIEVLYLVDGKSWKRETYPFSYAEVDLLKQSIIASNDFADLTGSALEDSILKEGLLAVAVRDSHFGLPITAWRVMEDNEPIFKVVEDVRPPLPSE